MPKIVFIGAGSGFGGRSFADIISFEELRDSEIVLVDINPENLGPVAAYCRRIVEAHKAPTRVRTASDWRGGVLDGADYVMTSFAQGGPAYRGVPFHYEITIPGRYGIHQYVADTAGIGGVFRALRCAPELIAIGKDMEARCPGAYLLNYVNPMAMLTRTLNLACPRIHMLGLCHNIQYGIRDVARWIGCTHKDLRYTAAGINHMDWFLTIRYLDGRDAYPDLLKAATEKPEIYRSRAVQFELLKAFGYFTTESSRHCAEYIPYFLPRQADRDAVFLVEREISAEAEITAPRWNHDSDLVQQTDGRKPLQLGRSFEYGMHIMHAVETGNVYRMHLNVINNGCLDNFTDDTCVEVCCTVDRNGVHPHRVGRMPVALAALCRGVADMQTMASDAILEADLNKALLACLIDPATAACASPARIRECFQELLAAERPWLEKEWGNRLGL
ncbi:MAG: alpha-glucosidase/alpha-galactosidase [Lentisphaeria bacterium]|nr:alpha-glucosidase/alpha-galactosidase [Lentisphaeria bacterium]